MDPCPFVRLTVGNLALKVPVAAKPARTVVHPSSSPCFCKIKLKSCPIQTAVIPYILSENNTPDGQPQPPAATFHLSKQDIDRLAGKSIFVGKLCLKIAIYTGRTGVACGVSSGRLLGKISVPLDFSLAESRAVVFHSGWISVGKESKGSTAQFHLNVKAEPDPRFVFQFDGEPECSPQVFQIQGNIRQPVFTCNFSFRNTGDRNQLSRSLASENGSARGWLSSFGSDREKGKERKGWSITVHDLSGSPVAAASMVTPFVASPGSDRVSRSNPGCWLILRPGEGTWNPWGRLEAWRERGSSDGLGYRFELIPDMGAAGVVLAEATLSTAKGGKFSIDLAGGNSGGSRSGGSGKAAQSSACSPRGSGDFGWSLYSNGAYRGFVMSARVEGEVKCSKPVVEVSVQHVSCTEDAAAYVALAAAVDLSIDACKMFSQKLRKELCNNNHEGVMLGGPVRCARRPGLYTTDETFGVKKPENEKRTNYRHRNVRGRGNYRDHNVRGRVRCHLPKNEWGQKVGQNLLETGDATYHYRDRNGRGRRNMPPAIKTKLGKLLESG